MTTILLRLLGVAGVLTLAAWLYWLTAKVQLLLSYAEQLLGTGARLLAVVPSQSAPRTAAPPGLQPRRWFQTLRRLARLPEPRVDDDEPLDDLDDQLARWADDGGPEPADVDDPQDDVATDTFPAIDPPTTPAGVAVDVWQHTEIPPRIEPDDVDRILARFDYAKGHHR